MKCRCKAKLDKCDVENDRCPASTWRLVYDTKNAMNELYENAVLDGKDKYGE
jgi:hypothetical protein